MKTEFGENKIEKNNLMRAGEKLFMETSERAEKITELVQNLRQVQQEIGINYMDYLNLNAKSKKEECF
ncbi:MAG: hypothetical protein ACOCQ4_03400 [bacterium]